MAGISDPTTDKQVPSSPSSSASRDSDPLDLLDDEGWEDAEPEDDEDQPVRGLFSDESFPNARAMLEDCKAKHGFDFVKTTRELGVYVYRQFDSLGRIARARLSY